MTGDITSIGKYSIVQRLDEGGMGTIYLARDPGLDRLVAIKVLRHGFDSDDLRDRFDREARAISRLRHPNIITIFEYGDFQEQPFIAMEYVTGESLREIIRRRAPLPLDRKLQMMEELCAGMAYAHRARIVHRDLKPANIMLDADGGQIKILDFGIARDLEASATRLTHPIGTPRYMSPEQAATRPVDHRSDIFSIGTLFYELLAYRRAFDGDSTTVILERIKHADPPPITDVCVDLDPAIGRVISTALQKAPADRYQDLEAMRVDVAAIRDRLARGSADGPVRAPEAPRQSPADGAIDAARSRGIATADREVEEFVRQARQSMDDDAFTEAERLLEAALIRRPDDVAVSRLQRELRARRRDSELSRERAAAGGRAIDRARAFLADGALQSAARTAAEALAHQPDSEAARAIRDDALAALERADQESENDWSDAEQAPPAAREPVSTEFAGVADETPPNVRLFTETRRDERSTGRRAFIGMVIAGLSLLAFVVALFAGVFSTTTEPPPAKGPSSPRAAAPPEAPPPPASPEQLDVLNGSMGLVILSLDWRRSLPITDIGGHEMIALDDLVGGLGLKLGEDGGAITLNPGPKVQLTPEQPFALVDSRVVSLGVAPVRRGTHWLVPLDFVRRVLAPIYKGLDLPPGSHLLVVDGAHDSNYQMQELIGLSGERAKELLSRHGFRVALQKEEIPYTGIPPGMVMRQSPKSGVQIKQGEVVLSLLVSR